MNTLIWICGVTVAALLLGAGLLHLVAACGAAGRRMIDALCHAPWVDIVLFYFTALPVIPGAIVAGWAGAGAALAGQVLAMLLWIVLHELTHADARRGPRIYRTLDRLVGCGRNHAALWITAVASPVLWPIRLAEVALYPWLVWLVRLPRYRHADWVSLSRYKFEGLVGYDLIWCLYCDWMTGVWSLGSEMLRNVESFWCPIRFYDGKKCENCKVDFPDVNGGWVPADGKMADVTAALEKHHGPGPNAWFGHPVRLTIKGRDIDQT